MTTTRALPGNMMAALVIASISVLMRPPAVLLWVFVGSVSLAEHYKNGSACTLLLLQVLPIGLAAFVCQVLIDRWFYGEWTFSPWNFFVFNVLKGHSKLYGTHSWYWYFVEGFPVRVGAQ